MAGMTLEATCRAIHDTVRENRSVAEVARELGVDERRLDIYRSMVRGHVYTALSANYDVLAGVLGEPLFDALYEAYLVAHPPSSWALNQAASAFPEFLATAYDAGRAGLVPFHGALAEFEWALYEVGVDPAEPEASERPTLNPTLAVLQTDYPVVPFVLAWQRGEGPAVPEPEATLSLVFQRPATGRAAFYNGSGDLLFALKMVHDGMDVATAAEASGHPTDVVEGLLAAAIDIGLVIAAR
jgi:hypothetical protein